MTTDRRLRVGLAFFGGVYVVTALFMIVAPGTFFDEVGPWGSRNDHYVRDLATYNLALGVVLLAALRFRSWRAPALAAAALQYAAHAVNHLVDISEADPEHIGPPTFAAIALGAILLAWLLREAMRERGS